MQMDSSSLADLLQQIRDGMKGLKWDYTNSPLFSITDEQLRIVGRYALELSVNSNFSLQMHQKWNHNEVWKRRFQRQNHEIISEMLMGFLRDDVKELFKLPKSSHFAHPKPLKRNEVVAAFIGFLVEVLHYGGKDYALTANYQALMVELRSLVAILGDTPFQATDHQQLQSILSKFECVANEAGNIVHSSLLFSDLVDVGAIAALIQQIDKFKENIIDFLNLFPNIGVAQEMNSFFTVDSLVYDLDELQNQDLNLPSDVKDLIGMLHGRLASFQNLINDVEFPKLSKEEGFEEAMVQIRDVAYDAEYLIKLFFVGDVPHWYLILRLTHLMERLKNIGFEPLSMKNDDDVLWAVEVAKASTDEVSQQFHSDPVVGDIMPVFESQENDIVDQLLGGTNEVKSIFIVGMAGVGKTTLASKLFNHPSLCFHFDKMVWCTVSQMPNWRNLFVSILSCLSDKTNKGDIEIMDEQTLTVKVYQCLKFRRFMIVVDDIWQLDDWKYLERFLPNDQNGSRILLTSRDGSVAESRSVVQLLPWSDDQCFQLLLHKKVFRNYKPGASHIEKIGKKIAAKCYGLPLVATVLAGILLATDKGESWLNFINDSADYSEQFDQSSAIMRVLELSYISLPTYLKPCFLYFGMFQEDEKIPVKKLKQLWIVEGFIPKKENERAEHMAEKCLQELIDKNLVIVTGWQSDGGIKFCGIHDLLRDLCLKIAEQENFWKSTSNKNSVDKQTCRLSFSNSWEDISFVAPVGLRLRSLFVTARSNRELDLLNMKLLRALECQPASTGILHLHGIELLFYLKYLAIQAQVWQGFFGRIPWIDLIYNSANLEFLTVQQSIVLTPEILGMLKLRYISSPKIEFGRDCETIQTSNLEFLSTLRVYEMKDTEKLGYLGRLRRLKCEYYLSLEDTSYRSLDFLCLTQCESLTVRIFNNSTISEIKLPSKVRKLNLYGLRLPWETMRMIAGLPNLEVLKLRWYSFVGDIWNTGDDEYRQLKHLKIENLDFTEWLIGSSNQFPRLQQLVLKGCYHLKEIPSEIGYIEALRLIELQGSHGSSLEKSARDIEKEQQAWGNDELKVKGIV